MTALKVRLVLSLVLMVLLGVAACDDPPPPVSNPGAGIDAPRTSPPPRFDWTDE